MPALTRARTARRSACLAGALVALAGLGACQRSAPAGVPATRTPLRATASGSPAATSLRLSVSPADAASAVAPNVPVVLTAAGGRWSAVSVSAATGSAVTGRFSPDRRTWTSTSPLAFSTTYSVAATGLDSRQAAQRLASTFTTVTPAALSFPGVIPLQGETVGVGLPIVIYWSHAVRDRAAAERLLKVVSDKPVTGSWHWLSNTEVHYRPRTFWPAHSRVAVHIAVGGADLGNGVYGKKSRTISFTVGSSVISRVSDATKTMTVTRDGKVLRTMAVSLGKPSTPSSAGTMVVIEKYAEKYFDSATFGVPRDAPGGYYTKVYWDTKYTYGGEYVHAAPWSTTQQGVTNVSHGCVNVSPANAEWFYHLSTRGDIVEVIGTERAVKPGDGLTDWNVSWVDWVAGSALH